MADLKVKISELPGADPLTGIELVAVVQGDVTKSRSVDDMVLEGGLKAHIDAADPHPQYTTDSEVVVLARDSITVSGDLSYNSTTGVITFNETYSTPAEVKTAYESNANTNAYTDTEKTKLSGIEAGAQVNTVDTVNGQTGTVVLDTDDVDEGSLNLYFTSQRAISAIQADSSWKASDWNTAYSWGDHGVVGYELASNKGQPNGYASLDLNGQVPSSQLPSFVDDVVEYASFSAFPATGEKGKMYVALDTGKLYRWSGTTYVYITSGAVDSVNGFTGVIVLDTGDISEGSNLYYTSERVKSEISVSGDLAYNSTTGVISFSETYSTPLELRAALVTVDGAGSGIDSDLLDGQHGAYYRDWTNVTNKPDPTITLAGDLSGSVTLTDLASGTLTATVEVTPEDLENVTSVNYQAGVVETAASKTSTATSEVVLASFDATLYGSAEVTIQASSGASRHITKLLVVHDGLDAFATEYGVVTTGGELFSVDVRYTLSLVEVVATPVSASSTNFRIKLIEFEV